jgi:hypothetical protein
MKKFSDARDDELTLGTIVYAVTEEMHGYISGIRGDGYWKIQWENGYESPWFIKSMGYNITIKNDHSVSVKEDANNISFS